MSDAMIIEKHLDMSLDEIAALRRKEKETSGKKAGGGGRPKQQQRPGSNAKPKRAPITAKGAGRRQVDRSFSVTVNQKEGGRRVGGGGARGGGGSRGDPEKTWGHDMFEEQYPDNKPRRSVLTGFASKSIGLMTTGVVTISNIPWEVEKSDLVDLFQDFEEFKSCDLVYDRSGRATGAALVHFGKRAAGRKFVEKYNGVKLDGRMMKVLEGDQSAEHTGDQREKDPASLNGGKVRGRGMTKFTTGTMRSVVVSARDV